MSDPLDLELFLMETNNVFPVQCDRNGRPITAIRQEIAIKYRVEYYATPRSGKKYLIK